MKKILIILSIMFCGVAFAHTIEWYVGDTLLSTTTCESGDNITPPTVPEKIGYHFKKWLEYIPIEYLESTGTQWIDTNIQFSVLTTSFDIVFEPNNIQSEYVFLFGAGSSSSGTRFWLIIGSNGTAQIGYGNQFYNVNTISILNKKIQYTFDIDETNTYFSFKDMYTNKNISQVTVDKQNYNTNNNIFLFRTNPVQVASNSIYIGKIYSCKIYDNNVLVRDFIPVLDLSGVPCMFDKVEKKFYYNAGTGDFIAGPAIDE